jgi:hypothetical protein
LGSLTSEDETHYLSAVLNSETVNEVIKPFQSKGLLGERHVHKKVLDVPFPGFNKEDTKHKELVRLGRLAQIDAKKAMKLSAFPSSTADQRGFIRKHLAESLEKIDDVVKALI